MRLAGRGQWLTGPRGSKEAAQPRDNSVFSSLEKENGPWRHREERGLSSFWMGGLDSWGWLFTVVVPVTWLHIWVWFKA